MTGDDDEDGVATACLISTPDKSSNRFELGGISIAVLSDRSVFA